MFNFKLGKYIQGRACSLFWPHAALSHMQDQGLLNNNALLGAVRVPPRPALAGPAHPLGLMTRTREPARGRIASQLPQLTYSLRCPLNSLTNNLTSSATTSLTNKPTNTGHQTQNPSLAAGFVCLCVCFRGQQLG